MADNCPGGVCVLGEGGNTKTWKDIVGSGPGNVGEFPSPRQNWDTSYWQSQADLVRSGTLDREATTAVTAHQLNTLGQSGQMNLYPEVYKGGGRSLLPSEYIGYDLMKEAIALQELRNEYTGPEGAWLRWVIGNKIQGLQNQVWSMRGQSGYREGKTAPPEIPDWMQPFIMSQPTPSKQGGKGAWMEAQGKSSETFKERPTVLRPLSAQEELTPEQMQWMAGYQAWGKAGFPQQYSEKSLLEMSDWEKHWTPYTRLSQSLFPKQQGLRPKWATARQ